MADKTMKIAVILSAYDKVSTVVNTAMNKVQARMEKARKGLNSFGNGALIAGAVTTAFFASTLHAAEENEIAVRRLEQVYRSMGQNVDQASKASQDYASKLSLQIAVEDEVIMAVQAKLATFSKVSDAVARNSGVMDRATAAAFDLAANGFGEASGNAIMLGKALQDPARGAMALARAGALNKGDLPIIKQIQASKGLAAAQQFVLKAIEKQVKGVAEATAPATAKIKIAWSEVTESIGKVLLPTVQKFAKYLSSGLIPKIQAFAQENPVLIKGLAATAVAFVVVGTAAKVLALILAMNPIVLWITAIAAAAFFIYKNWGGISKWFAGLWAKVTAAFSKAWSFIKSIFFNYTPAGLIYSRWSQIVGFFHTIWERVKGKFMGFIDYLKELPGRFMQSGIDIINGLWTGLKSKWEDVKSWFEEKMNWVDNIAQYFNADAKVRVQLREVNKYIDNQVGATSNNITGNNARSGITPALNPVKSSNSLFQYAPVINYTGAGGKEDVTQLSDLMKNDFSRQFKDYQAKQERTKF